MDTHNLVQSFGSCFTPIDHRSILLGYGRQTERYVKVLLDMSRRSDVFAELNTRNDVTVAAPPPRLGYSGGCFLQPWTECATDGVRHHRHQREGGGGGYAGAGGVGVRGGGGAVSTGIVVPPRDNTSSHALDFSGSQSKQLTDGKGSAITQQLRRERQSAGVSGGGQETALNQKSPPMTSLYHEDHVRWYRRHKAAAASSSVTPDLSSPSLLFRRHYTTIVEKKQSELVAVSPRRQSFVSAPQSSRATPVGDERVRAQCRLITDYDLSTGMTRLDNNNSGASPCDDDSLTEKESKGSGEGEKVERESQQRVVRAASGGGGGGGLAQLYRRQQSHSATRRDRVAVAAKLHPPIDVLHKSKRILYAPTPSRDAFNNYPPVSMAR